MKILRNKAFIFFWLLGFFFYTQNLHAQLVYNNGATINAKQGVIVYVDGAVQNESGQISVDEDSGLSAELIIKADFINNATAEGNGYYRVFGNWENNNIFNAGSGSVFLEGDNQLLTGSVPTYFNNLILDGSGIKTQTLNQFVTGTLDLQHLELNTDTYGMFVESAELNSVLRTEGFVSSLGAGFLSRNTQASDIYLFPVGSSEGVARYRPVEITPENSTENTYTVRMANLDATSEGYDRDLKEEAICETNPYFYHRIDRTNGSSPVNMKIFFDNQEDGNWEGIANWTTSPDEWQIVEGSSSTSSVPMYYAYVDGWNTFNETPYILYNEAIIPEFAQLGPYCVNGTPDLLPSTSLNGVEGTWDPPVISTGQTGSFSYEFTPLDTECVETATMIIMIEPGIEPEFDEFGPYCVGDTPDLLPTISNNGIEGTWDPESINTSVSGIFTYTFTPTGQECAEIVNIEISIQEAITPVFTQSGPYCVGDIPQDLPLVSNNGVQGTWEPPVINTSTAGFFTHIFTPDIEGCYENAEMTIEIIESDVPVFGQFGPYCVDETPDVLPLISNNGIEGSWEPPVINTSIAGQTSYTFTPEGEECAETIIIDIIVEENIVPDFTQLGPYCIGDTPGELSSISNNGIPGEWDPPVINTSIPATTIHTFTPTEEGCYDIAIMTVEVSETIIPLFTQLGPYCVGDTPDELPLISTNGVSGTWEPPVINTSSVGTLTHTFTPTYGECVESVIMEIVTNETIEPVFDIFGPYCTGDTPDELPTISNNGIEGIWEPPVINTAIAGSATYTFIPEGEICADIINIEIIIEENIVPIFTQLGPYCIGDTPGILPETSNNGVQGTWDPPTINTSTAETTIHTFTPAEEGCYESTTMTVEIGDQIVPVFTQLGPYCEGESPDELPSISNNGVEGTWDPPVINTLITGTTTYTFTPNVEECVEITSMDIVVMESVEPVFGDFGPYCTGDIPDELPAISDNGINGTWDPTQINTTIQGETIYTFTPSVEECAEAISIIVTVNPNPEITIIPVDALCIDDDPVQVAAIPVGGVWEGPGISPEGIFDPSIAGIGSHQISYTVTEANCTSTEILTIDVFDSPDATIDPVSPLCSEDSPISLTAATEGGLWSGEGIVDQENGVFDPGVAGVGNHEITYTVGTGSCIGFDEIIITVNPNPEITIIPVDALCIDDDPVQVAASPVDGVWEGPGISPEGIFDPSIAGIGSHQISYTVTEANCTSTEILTIDVFDSPDATIDPVSPLCSEDSPISLTAATEGGLWSGEGIVDQENGVFDPGVAGVGNHEITYTVGAGSCIGFDEIIITVNPNPEITIIPVEALCIDDDPVQVAASPEDGIWEGPGISPEGIFDPSIAGIGSHQISYTVTEANCTSTEILTIDVFDSPDATIEPVSSLCYGDPTISLTAATQGGLWSGDGIIDAENGIFDPSVAGAGEHVITYTVGTPPCSASDQITIIVYDVPAINIPSAGPFCYLDNPITLVATPEGGVWSGIGITDSEAGVFDPSEANIGENIITYYVEAGACSASDSIIITIFESADATIEPVPPLCYENITINLSANTPGGTWSGTGVTPQGVFNVAIAGVGSHDIYYTITGECGDSDMITIIVYPADIEAAYITDEPKCIGGTDGVIIFEVTGGTSPYVFEWDEDGYSEYSEISGLSAGEYEITITDANGCKIIVREVIIKQGEDDCIFIPNAFTPNGDGINDQWIIENIESFPEYYVQIFNRWGQELFSARHGHEPWDGKHNGKPVPTGTYIYVVKPGNDYDPIIGTVTVVR